jgi:hypothetical protein
VLSALVRLFKIRGGRVRLCLLGHTGSICSGSQQALLYENLRDEGDEARYEAAAGICGAASTAGVIGALVYGGLIYA